MAERGEGEGREVTDAEDAEWVSIECSFHFEKNRIETIKHALNSCSNKRRGTYGRGEWSRSWSTALNNVQNKTQNTRQ